MASNSRVILFANGRLFGELALVGFAAFLNFYYASQKRPHIVQMLEIVVLGVVILIDNLNGINSNMIKLQLLVGTYYF
jgi:hypothetical protein